MSATAETSAPNVTMHALGRYLASLPVLADLIREELSPKLSRATTDGEFRGLRRQAVDDIVKRHKDAKAAYRVHHFTEEQVPCKVDGCREAIVGVYLEVVNPITRADIKLPFLGVRGIRLCLSKPEIFRVQIRVLLRAGVHGELKVMLINHGSAPFAVRRGERLAQMVVAPVSQVVFEEVEGLDETERGMGGHGSTGR